MAKDEQSVNWCWIGDLTMGVCWADNAYRADDFAVHGSFYNSGVVGSAACFPGGVVQSRAVSRNLASPPP